MITDLSKINNAEELQAGKGVVLPAEERTLEIVAAEIRGYTFSMLTNIIEIGRRLVEAKGMIQHGQFMNWCKENFGFSSSQTNNFMQLYRAYGADQNSLFGAELNSQTFGNLNYSKALALLALPSPEEREAFVEEHDVENMTTKELKQAIKERDEAIKREKAAIEERDRTMQDLSGAKAEAEKMKSELETLSDDRDDLERLRDEAEKKLAEAQKQLKELESRPVEVAVERDEAAIAEAATLAREKAEAEAKKKIAALEKKLNKAEDEAAAAKKEAQAAGEGAAEKEAAAKKEADALRAELEEARKQLKASDSDVTAFGIRFNTIQNEYGYLIAELRKVDARDAETGEKLREAVRQLIGYFTQELEVRNA